MVFSLAYHFLRDRGAAEELAQDVFLALYRSLASIQSETHLCFWLRKVTSHRCIDYARRNRQRRWPDITQIPEPAAVEPERDPWLAESLRALVAGLPAKHRMAVVLRFQEDLPPAEIAALLDMPIDTVKSNLRRALLLLRAKLERSRKEAHV